MEEVCLPAFEIDYLEDASIIDERGRRGEGITWRLSFIQKLIVEAEGNAVIPTD